MFLSSRCTWEVWYYFIDASDVRNEILTQELFPLHEEVNMVQLKNVKCTVMLKFGRQKVGCCQQLKLILHKTENMWFLD